MAIGEDVKNAQKTMRETSAGIIIYRRDREGVKFLLLYHGNGYWNFAKGKLENKPFLENGFSTQNRESSFKAALREAREETGLTARDLRFREFFKVYDHYSFSHLKEKIFKTVIYYLAETRQSKIQISSEHDGYGWFLYKDAVKLLRHQNLKNNLKNVFQMVKARTIHPVVRKS